MLKVMLIGDSIRMGYETRLRELVAGDVDLRAPEENCRFTAYTLFSLSTWAPDNDYDVIHWNNGQWDTCYMPDGRIHTPLPVYLELQQRVIEILRPRTRRLVFATTTPVHDDQYRTAAINGRKNEDIEAYNQAVSEILGSMGIEINDLHAAVVQDVGTYICDDKVHLSEEGIELCARKVAEVLLSGT